MPVSTGALRTVITIPTKTVVETDLLFILKFYGRSANDLIRIHIPIEHFGLVQRKGGHSQRGLPSIILGHFAPMISGPTQEPTLRGEQTVDAALLTVVLALFVASAFGLTELPGGESSWSPKEWKGVHDGSGRSSCHCWHGGRVFPNRRAIRLRNRVWAAMALCWVGDIALTFSGDAAFLIGLVSFLIGHVLFILALRQAYRLGSGLSALWVRAAACGLLAVEAAAVVRALWEPAGELGPAVAVYAFVITIMASLSWFLAPGPGVRALRLGSTAFVASDMILAFGRFGEEPIAHGHLCDGHLHLGPMGAGGVHRCVDPSSQPSVRMSPTARTRWTGLPPPHAQPSKGQSGRKLTASRASTAHSHGVMPRGCRQPDEVSSENGPGGRWPFHHSGQA